MSLDFRRLIKDFLVYGMGDFMIKALAVITMPIYTRLFTPDQYGVWSYINTVVGLLGGFLVLGGDSAYARYYFEAKTHEERQELTSTLLVFLAAWGGGIVLLAAPFASQFSWWSFGSRQYGLLYVLALFAGPIGLLNVICGQILRNQFRPRLFTILSFLTGLLTVGLGVSGVLLLHLGLAGVLGGALIAQIVMLPLRLWTVRDMIGWRFSGPRLRDMLSYGVPLVPVSLAYWVFSSSDRMVLGKLSTLEQVGLYAVANSLVSILSFLNGALSQAWSPHAVRAYEEDPARALVWFGRVMTYLLLTYGLICVGLTSFSREALMILSSERFYPAAVAVGPLAVGIVAMASTQVTGVGISLSKKTGYFSLFAWLAALLNLGLNVLFVPRGGMVASSWATAAAFVFLTLGYLLVSQRFCPVTYEGRKVAVILALTLGFTAAVPLLPTLPLAHDIVFKGGYVLAYIGGLFLFQAIDRGDREGLVSVIQGTFRRLGASPVS